MKTKHTPVYHFLSGGTGVGKSVLLQALHQALLKYFSHKPGENPDSLHVLICAPTGKAAFNVGGYTIHSAFHIPAEQGFNFKPLDMQQLSSLQCKFSSLKVVFIYEISMVGRKMFHYINMRLQEIKGCLQPFGGISVIAFGDLFQLKPVMDSWIFSPHSSSICMSSLASNLWTDLFSLFELDEIMRQKDDLTFAQILNRLREGEHTAADIDAVKGQIIQNESDELKKTIHLFSRRHEVNHHNQHLFDQLQQSQKTIVTAIDSVAGEFQDSLREKIISKIPDDSTKTKGLLKYLCLGVNTPAEICINVDISDGLTNGTPCTIKKLDFRVPNSNRSSIVWVEFGLQDIGKKVRSRYRHLYTDGISLKWTPILEITRKFSYNFYQSF